MTTDQIRYFIVLAQTASFRGTAEQFFISEPTLSRQIAALEEELGTVLLIRDRKGVKLTAAGEVFYKGALSLTQELQQLVLDVKDAAKSEGLHLTIAVQNDQIVSDRIRRALDIYLSKYPKVSVSLCRVPTGDLYISLMQGKYDFINLLGLGTSTPDGMGEILLSEDPSCLAVSASLGEKLGEEITPQEAERILKKTPLVLPSSELFNSPAKPLRSLKEEYHVEPSPDMIRFEHDAMSLPLSIAAGLCISVCNSTHMMSTDPGIRLVRVKDAGRHRKLLLYSTDSRNPCARDFLAVLRSLSEER